jgi:hypothetical protein
MTPKLLSLPRHGSAHRLARNSSNSGGTSETISESISGAEDAPADRQRAIRAILLDGTTQDLPKTERLLQRSQTYIGYGEDVADAEAETEFAGVDLRCRPRIHKVSLSHT